MGQVGMFGTYSVNERGKETGRHLSGPRATFCCLNLRACQSGDIVLLLGHCFIKLCQSFGCLALHSTHE